MSLDEVKNRREQRLEICRECDFFNKFTSQCDKCGCFMSVKTMFEESQCPIGKW